MPYDSCRGGDHVAKICRVVGGLNAKKSNGGTQYYQQDRIYDVGEIALCLPANLVGGGTNT